MTRSVEVSAYNVFCPHQLGDGEMRVGTVRQHPKGWKFYPALPARLPSRNYHGTKEAAIPSWVGKHSLRAIDASLNAARNMGWSV